MAISSRENVSYICMVDNLDRTQEALDVLSRALDLAENATEKKKVIEAMELHLAVRTDSLKKLKEIQNEFARTAMTRLERTLGMNPAA